MATVRLVVVLFLLGGLVLLGVQNLATALPLVFLGGSTQSLPLGVWLVGAAVLGALTTLTLTALLGSAGNGTGARSQSYKYRPQSFYEPADAAADRVASANIPRPNTPPPYSSPGAGRSPSTPPSSARSDASSDDDPSWRAWTNLKSPAQWSDWEALSQAPRPEVGTASQPSPVDSVLNWFSTSRREAFQRRQVHESMRELDDDWGELENRRYRAPGVSPVEDTLDELEQGWGEGEGSMGGRDRSFEADQAPRRVYRDGSLYSYSYRDEDSTPERGQVDNIYAPPDDAIYGDEPDNYSPEYPLRSDYDDYSDDYSDGAPPQESGDTSLGEPELAEDGVVDADYRVLEPPYAAAAEAAAAATPWPGSDSDADRPEDHPPQDQSPRGDRDEWDDADDALTP